MTNQPSNPSAPAPLSPEEDKKWASFAHLSGILLVLPPLIIWLIFKDRGAFTKVEGKEALNFQIIVILLYTALSILNLVFTFLELPIQVANLAYLGLFLANIVLSIKGFLSASKGNHFWYPIPLRLIK